jgi:hypothetical protein
MFVGETNDSAQMLYPFNLLKFSPLYGLVREEMDSFGLCNGPDHARRHDVSRWSAKKYSMESSYLRGRSIQSLFYTYYFFVILSHRPSMPEKGHPKEGSDALAWLLSNVQRARLNFLQHIKLGGPHLTIAIARTLDDGRGRQTAAFSSSRNRKIGAFATRPQGIWGAPVACQHASSPGRAEKRKVLPSLNSGTPGGFD